MTGEWQAASRERLTLLRRLCRERAKRFEAGANESTLDIFDEQIEWIKKRERANRAVAR